MATLPRRGRPGCPAIGTRWPTAISGPAAIGLQRVRQQVQSRRPSICPRRRQPWKPGPAARSQRLTISGFPVIGGGTASATHGRPAIGAAPSGLGVDSRPLRVDAQRIRLYRRPLGLLHGPAGAGVLPGRLHHAGLYPGGLLLHPVGLHSDFTFDTTTYFAGHRTATITSAITTSAVCGGVVRHLSGVWVGGAHRLRAVLCPRSLVLWPARPALGGEPAGEL